MLPHWATDLTLYNVGYSSAFQRPSDFCSASVRRLSSPVQLQRAVLARLSKAAIDAFILQVGRAICYNFALEPHAQEQICDAILKLKKYGSYEDLIWFGFGIKDVVTDLADTEEGLTLVALCATLSTTYDSTFAAMVTRELYVLCKAPQSFTPALRQWKTLVDLCTGMLTSAHFVVIANGFRRFISGHLHHLVKHHMPTTHAALADAILTLARISKRKFPNPTFSMPPFRMESTAPGLRHLLNGSYP